MDAAPPAATLTYMLRPLLLLGLAALISLGAAGCWWGKNQKPKSSARIYEGDSPSIHMTEEQTAGGPLRPYR